MAVEAVVVPVGLDELPALLISEAVIVLLDKALPNNPARAFNPATGIVLNVNQSLIP